MVVIMMIAAMIAVVVVVAAPVRMPAVVSASPAVTEDASGCGEHGDGTNQKEDCFHASILAHRERDCHGV